MPLNPVSPQGLVGLFTGKGRLRTFSSTVKLRKLDQASEETQRERSRWVYYIRLSLLPQMGSSGTGGINIVRRGLTALLILKQGSAKAGQWDKREVETPTSFLVSYFSSFLLSASGVWQMFSNSIVMEKKNKKNEELQSRRDFFKKAAKATLPILGAVMLSSIPVVGQASEGHKDPMGCSRYGCGICTNSCKGNCKGGCQTTCSGGCKYYACKGVAKN